MVLAQISSKDKEAVLNKEQQCYKQYNMVYTWGSGNNTLGWGYGNMLNQMPGPFGPTPFGYLPTYTMPQKQPPQTQAYMTQPQMPQMQAQPYIPQQQTQPQWQAPYYMPQLPMQPLQPSVVYQLGAERHIIFYFIYTNGNEYALRMLRLNYVNKNPPWWNAVLLIIYWFNPIILVKFKSDILHWPREWTIERLF